LAKIPYVLRRGARFHYRRRLPFLKINDRPLSVPLMTSDPEAARARAAALSARFEAVRSGLIQYGAGDWLDAEKISALFRAELTAALGKAVRRYYSGQDPRNVARDHEIMAEAYDVARRLDRPDDLSGVDELALRHQGYSEHDIDWIRMCLDRFARADAISDEVCIERLASIGIAPSDTLIEIARNHIQRARAAAHRRAALFVSERVQQAENPVQALLDLPMAMDGPAYVSPPRAASQSAAEDSGPFVVRDSRRFWDVVDDLVATLKADGRWSRDCRQQRRIAMSFGWITGNKRLCDYTHLDVDAYKQGLRRLPATFRYGTPTSGAMSRPFADVVAELGEMPKGKPRSDATLNRDLSFMSTIASELAKTAWRPRIPNTKVLDFASAMVKGGAKKEEEELRPPWTKEHVAAILHSRIYTGGAGAKKRLKAGTRNIVYHDAAYWLPLLWFYHHTCREEMAGLAVEDVVADHPIPHIRIINNVIRAKEDGEKAGEKRAARRRSLPIHPELLRLGFLDYHAAIVAEGHAALFPELYINSTRRGGDQYYSIAWRYVVRHLAETMPIPKTDNGKEADIHSIRSLGSSFYEVDGVNEILRADVFGHARQGTNAKHYSKRMKTEGLDTVLKERLEFICRYVPVLTSDLKPHPIKLLALEHRSRVGSGGPRKQRADQGTKRKAA
jgi:hypothetical protein